MKHLFLWLIVVLGLVALLMFGLAQAREAAARHEYARAAAARARGEAQAMIINAQAESRLHTQAANLPYVILGVVAIFGSVILYLVVARPTAPQYIERSETRIILVVEPGNSRRVMWRRLSQVSDEVQLLADKERGRS